MKITLQHKVNIALYGETSVEGNRSMNCIELMQAFDSKINSFVESDSIQDWDLCFRAECEDDWTKDYAIGIVDIIEPIDTRYFDVYALKEDIVQVLVNTIGEKFKVIWGRSPKLPTSGYIARIHELGGGWELEIELYRVAPTKQKKKAAAKKTVAKKIASKKIKK